MDKIKTIEELAGITKKLRDQGKKVVHCHGVFDLLHIGHIRYFSQARRLGDVLVVTITPDCHVDKGPNRPAFTEALRSEAIASLSCVDYVAVNLQPTAEEALRLLKPDFFVKGSEFKEITSDRTGKIGKEAKVVEEIGATLAFTEDIVFSSSNLINRYMSNFSDEVEKYLSLFRKRWRLEEVLDVLDKMSSLKVMVIGDTIIDEYQYCEALGKSSKDPVLALKYESHELFAGGVLAIANHVANFTDQVTLISVLGEHNNHEDFIRSQLHAHVSPRFAVQPGAPTLVKRRFIDGYSLNKMFEVYVMDGSHLPEEVDRKLCEQIEKEISNYDLVIAADFGHGAISNAVVELLKEKANFLCVNTQANAGNRGFHAASRYPNADYVCIAEHEARLEMRDLKSALRPLTHHLSDRLNCSRLVVTCGKKGCAISDRDGEFMKVPSFTSNVVDRVGAGDAFLSITAGAAALNTPSEITAFLGNVAGSLAVAILGNKKAIDKAAVEKYIVSLMK